MCVVRALICVLLCVFVWESVLTMMVSLNGFIVGPVSASLKGFMTGPPPLGPSAAAPTYAGAATAGCPPPPPPRLCSSQTYSICSIQSSISSLFGASSVNIRSELSVSLARSLKRARFGFLSESV